MSTTLDLPPRNFSLDRGVVDPEGIRNQVWGLLGSLYPESERVERRKDARYPYPYLVYLTPVAEDGATPDGESIVVVGKHLCEHGFGFYHPKPLPYRRMIATLETGGGLRLAFLMDLNWCRFTHRGWYESGGRFLQVVPSPIGAAD
jgi:hypothetical protein